VADVTTITAGPGSALARLECALIEKGCNPGKGQARCPAHDDRTPSLSFRQGTKIGGVVVTCHAGCSLDDITASLGMTRADLFDAPRNSVNHDAVRNPTRRIDPETLIRRVVATYPYTDENGELLYEVLRYSPKDFRQRRPGGQWGLGDTRRVLYHLPEVLRAIEEGKEIWIAEGEKDVDALRAAGVTATCAPMGAGKWTNDYAQVFKGASVVIVVADKDEPGRRHAADVFDSIVGVVDSVVLTEAKAGKDSADHFAAGFGLDDFPSIERDELTAPDDTPAASDTPLPAQPIRMKSGDTFVLDDPAELEPIWGAGDDVLWASGESLVLAGPTGVGKSTVELQVIGGQLGTIDEVLGYPVKPSERPVLLCAMDRPRQIRRAMRRLFGEQHRDVLHERLIVWEGPLPLDLGRAPETLVELAQSVGAGSVWLDSLKDAAVKLADDEGGGKLNRAIQMCLAAGIDVAGPHHQRKGQGGARPNTLEDVYGSTWITAGAGSVVLLWGAAGDPIVDMVHLKQPAAEVGPLKVEHEHITGRSTVFRGQADPFQMLKNAGAAGLTPMDLARVMFECDRPTDTQRKKAQRRLEQLVANKTATRDDAIKGGAGGSAPVRYHLWELIK
jgi:AAA domain